VWFHPAKPFQESIRWLGDHKVDTLSTFTKKRRQFTKETMTSQATFLHEFIK